MAGAESIWCTVNPILNESVTVVLDGSGNGTAKISPFGPRNGGIVWLPSQVAVSVSTNVKEAQANLYISLGIQSIDASNLIGQTATGSSGDTCAMPNVPLRPGDWITVVWTGGDVGGRATMRISGSVSPPGSL